MIRHDQVADLPGDVVATGDRANEQGVVIQAVEVHPDRQVGREKAATKASLASMGRLRLRREELNLAV